MDGFLKALGFESKPDYTDKIPETLTPEDFYVHKTFHHGFPYQPTCLDYDPVQQLLAVGTQNGRVLILGKPGLERYLTHPKNQHVLQLKFISNKGLLVTMCDPRTLYLWSLKEKNPSILHTMELTKESPTCMSYSFGSNWLFVGTDAGNVHVVHIKTFKVSGFTIYWNHALDVSYRGSPGEVKSVEEHPMDQSKLLIAFGCGYCVLYDMRCNNNQALKDAKTDPHKRFWYEPGHSHVLTSTCWLGNGRGFVCAYSNGSVVQWNIKTDNKPEKIFFVHETSDTTTFKPVYKIQVVHTDSEHPWYFCSGGFLEDSSEAPRTLTVIRGKSISMLSSSSTILDFLCLPSSPFPYQSQRPFALVILSKDELIFHDLLTPTFPKFDSSLLPYALDIHHPPVSSIQYCATCPEEFVGLLHSVRSKTVTVHDKPWPLKGGKWGQEVPHTSTDLILTGHTDGSVRLWHCSSVILQPFFTIHTSTYFKMNYQQSSVNLQSPPSGKKSSALQASQQKRVPPSRPPPPSKPPPRSFKAQLSHPSGVHFSADVGAAKEHLVSKSTSNPQLSISIPEPETEPPEQRINNTPSPATGQLRPENRELLDGGEAAADRGGSPESDRRTIFSREKKSIFKKKRNSDSPVRFHDSNRLDVANSGKDEKKSSPKLTKSFKKVAKIVKLSSGVRKSQKKPEAPKEDEVDGVVEENVESGSEDAISPANSHTQATPSEEQDVSDAPKRPSDIALRQTSTTESVGTTSGSSTSSNLGSVQRSSSSSSDDFVHIPFPASTPASDDSSRAGPTRSKTPKTPTLPKLPETRETFSSPPPMFSVRPRSQVEGEKEFFSINEMHICTCGQWLCVSNTGGTVMAYDFQIKGKKTPKYLEVNFGADSVVKQYIPGSANTPKESTSTSPTSPAPLSPDSTYNQWVFEEKAVEAMPGFQLVQVVSCSVQSCNGTSGRESVTSASSNSISPIQVTVSSLQYHIDMGLLAIGTNSGFAVVDTFNNTCLYTLSSLTSILYMADPTRFTRQMKRESQLCLNVSRKPTIKRHATSMAFTVKGKEGGQSPSKPVHSAKMISNTPRTLSQPQFVAASVKAEEECGGMVTLSELDSCVSAIEIVQLQLDKQCPPTLTLWVGLASGYVVAYGVNMIKGEERESSKKRIELVPTRFITETGKSPIVGLFFLNMWGDCQVVPYSRGRTQSVSSEGKLEYAIQGDRNLRAHQQKAQSPSTCPQHYAIIVDETQIKSYSFPGFNKINSCSPPISRDSVILRSQYFSCQDLPCLMSVTSCHQLLVHSLPGLKPLMKMPFDALHEAMVMCTFRVSGMGQALYLSSPSEIQRLSIVQKDRLNLPNCLPSLHVSVKDPPQTPTSKGLLGLFTSSPTLVDQSMLFGESARRPIGNLYKLDGRSGTVYSGRESEARKARRDREVEDDYSGGPHDGDQLAHRKAGNKGVSAQMERNVEALHLRKEKLSNIEKRTADVAENASNFADMAARLARKYEKR